MQNKINSIPEQHADLDSQRPDGGQARVSTKRGPVTVAQVRWSKLFAEGWRLAKLCRQLVFVYVLLYLIQGFAQNFGVQFVGTVTNKLNELVHSSANGPVAGGPEARGERFSAGSSYMMQYLADEQVRKDSNFIFFLESFGRNQAEVYTESGPIEFVDQLLERWQERYPDDTVDDNATDDSSFRTIKPDPEEEVIFVSYAR